MLLKKPRAHLIHKRHAENKVYIPSNSRENHYLVIELELSAELEKHDGIHSLKQLYFDICRSFRIKNAMFVANDKYVKVRYGEESQVIETDKQLLVFYDPKCHTGFKSVIKNQPNKVNFVVLANGDSIRENACHLHQKVTHLIAELAEHSDISIERFKIRDLQHITYDVFDKEKGNKKTVTHGFREITRRYQTQSLIIPKSALAHRFVIVNIPISYELSSECENPASRNLDYTALYENIREVCLQALVDKELKQGALIANNSAPFVSATGQRFITEMGELTKLGFDFNDEQGQFDVVYDREKLADTVSLIISPTVGDETNKSYGRFVNRCNEAIRNIAKALDIQPEKQRLMVRFHQHLQYRITELD